jgi:hypothetical protein
VRKIAPPPTIDRNTCGSPHPSVGWRTSPNVGPARPSAQSAAPVQSGVRRSSASTRPGIRAATISVAAITGTLTAKIQRQSSESTICPPTSGPTSSAMPV